MFTRGIPSATNRLVSTPVLLVKSTISPQMTTVDTKCGIYVMDCDSRLKRVLRTSLSRIANNIGTGKENISSLRLMASVLRSSLGK